jgi:alcohol dehydrogenase
MKNTQQSRSLLLTGPRALVWEEEPITAPGPGQILVRTIAGAISIGSELPQYLGDARGDRLVYPRMTGYESLAAIEACGPDVDLPIGQRVLAFYGHRTAAILPVSRVITVPEGVTDEAALLAILACDSAKGVGKLTPQPGEQALITGAGTIGLLALFNLRAHGVVADMVDPLPGRRALATALGARSTLDPSIAYRFKRSYALGLECSSRDRAFRLLQHALKPHGRLCVLSDGNIEPLTLIPAFHTKELLVVGSSDGLDYPSYAAWFWDELRRSRAPVELLFEHRIGAAELAGCFEQLANGDIRPVKVLVKY